MKNLVLTILGLATAGAMAGMSATPAAAQEWLVNRERFRFIGTRLTIEVVAESPGSIQVLRGQDGWVGVAGRAPAGLTTAGLSDEDRLTLSAAGDGPVNYMVTVPEGVWVVVRLPDRFEGEAVGGHTRLRRFDWATPVPAGTTADIPVILLPTDDGPLAGLFTTYAAGLAPARVAIPDLRAVRALTVRTGAARFRIATSRPLTLEPGSSSSFEIRPVGEPMDIVIDIPEGTGAFNLTAQHRSALILDGGAITTLCGPFTRQWLAAGREWVTFSPVDGRLECGPESGSSRPRG